MDNRELFKAIIEAKKGNLSETFKIILEFEDLINKESCINGQLNQECKDYIIDDLLKKIKKFKKI